MAHTAKPTRENRTITVDFHDEATYDRLLDDTKAFVEFILASSARRVFSSSTRPAAARMAA